MVVEEIPKSTITEDQINNNPKDDDDNDLDLEDGEILDDEDSSATSKTLVQQSHPLENSWTFWFDNPSAKSKQAAWGSSIRPVYTFSTVEEFWSIYNNIHHPSKLVVGADFHCFKHKIEPKWEDPICSNGGKWTMTFPKGKSDTSWLYTLLAMIGEQFDHGDEICGAVVNVRNRQEKISIWTKNASNESAQLQSSSGEKWKLEARKSTHVAVGSIWVSGGEYCSAWFGLEAFGVSSGSFGFVKTRYCVISITLDMQGKRKGSRSD